jgi:hypothetical protein
MLSWALKAFIGKHASLYTSGELMMKEKVLKE